jgi:endonuclease/exonuclease/phosphatase family metal-dependent hydrolase
LIGIQEAGPHMLKTLKDALDEYDSFGVGRDQKGESTPIFVKKGKFKVIESHTIWLTHTPLVESSILGSNHPRIATYVVLEMKDGKIIAFFNTHLDYTGDQTTLVQTKHLLNYIKTIENKYQALVVICGDFNSYPSTETIKLIEKEYTSCYQEKHKNQLTFHGFSNLKEGEPIDYIFFNNDIKMISFEIIDHLNDHPFLSDHYPISVKLS